MNITKLKNANRWKPDGFRPLGICTLGFLAAFISRSILSPFLDESLSMLFFGINCVVMSYLFGAYYSMALLIISIPTALFFFRKPFYVIDVLTREDVFTVVIYIGIVTLASVIIELLQRERYAAELRQRVSETRYRLLIESDQARRAENTRQFTSIDASNNDSEMR